MIDLISRQAAIEALGERPIVWTDDDQYTLGERNQYDIDRLAIETLPSAQPEDKCSECDAWNKYKNYPQLRWIPVSEKPIPKGLILVTYNDGGIDLLNQPTSYRQGDIVAWMPLPEPYKEKRR